MDAALRAFQVPLVAAEGRLCFTSHHEKNGRFGRFSPANAPGNAYSAGLTDSRCASFSRIRADFPERSRR